MNEAGDPALRFGVLGSLRVWRDETAVELGPVQQRVVLAVLALQEGRPVGLQQIISAVWGEAPPRHAVNLVQRHVSGLRRVLEPSRPGRTPSDLLTWTEAGYQLAMPAGSLDLAGYESELARARAARAAGHIEDAAGALRDALRLWRGPLCDGLSSPFLGRAARPAGRVADQRGRGAHRARAGDRRRHRSGRGAAGPHRRAPAAGAAARPAHAGAVPGRPPGRRAGGLRRGAAEAARRARRGARGAAAAAAPADPAADPQLAAAPAAEVSPDTGDEPAASPRRPLPAQLPHRIPDFTGRDAELGRLDALLAADSGGAGTSVVITTITGTAGVGKSALAVHWAHQVSERFPAGQLHVNLRGFDPGGAALDPAEAIRGFLDAFGVAPQQIPASVEENYGKPCSGSVTPTSRRTSTHSSRPFPGGTSRWPGSPRRSSRTPRRSRWPGA